MLTGENPININVACPFGTVVHEILHSIGMAHEHSRTDRNAMVEIDPSFDGKSDYDIDYTFNLGPYGFCPF